MNQVGVMRPPRSGTSKQLNTSGSSRGNMGAGGEGISGLIGGDVWNVYRLRLHLRLRCVGRLRELRW